MELKIIEKTIEFPTLSGIKVSWLRTGPACNHHMTVMLPIDDKIEKKLDKKETFDIEWNGRKFRVMPRNVFAYGELNLNDEDDIELIYECKISIPDDGIWIYSDYNYKTNTTKTKDGRILQYTSFDNYKIIRQAYGMLGCPKKIILFKVYAPYIVHQIRRTF